MAVAEQAGFQAGVDDVAAKAGVVVDRVLVQPMAGAGIGEVLVGYRRSAGIVDHATAGEMIADVPPWGSRGPRPGPHGGTRMTSGRCCCAGAMQDCPQAVHLMAGGVGIEDDVRQEGFLASSDDIRDLG